MGRWCARFPTSRNTFVCSAMPPPPSSLPTIRRAALALLPPSRGPGRAAGPPRPCRGAMLRQEKARPQGAAPPLACLGSAHLEPAPPASRPGPVGGDILPFLSSPAGTAAARASTPVGWPEGRWSPCAGCTCCHVAEPPAARGGGTGLQRGREGHFCRPRGPSRFVVSSDLEVPFRMSGSSPSQAEFAIGVANLSELRIQPSVELCYP